MIIDAIKVAERKAQCRRVFGDELMDWVESIASGAVKFSLSKPHDFVTSVISKYDTYGTLSPKQAEALRKYMGKSTEPYTGPEMPAGRQSFCAVVKKAEFRETDFGPTVKLMLQSDDGWRCWGNADKRMWEVARAALGFGDDYARLITKPARDVNTLCPDCLEFDCECSVLTQKVGVQPEPAMEEIAAWFVGKRFNVTANLDPQEPGFGWMQRARMEES